MPHPLAIVGAVGPGRVATTSSRAHARVREEVTRRRVPTPLDALGEPCRASVQECRFDVPRPLLPWHIPRIASFVLVHGGWGGGWEWHAVARELRAQGHDAWTPTLTGTGERAHLGGPGIGVETHMADLIGVLEHEDLEQVVLCGHSDGGIPVTGAADRQPERVRLLVYVDALIPRDGESAFDLLPASFAQFARASAAAHGDGWRVSMPAAVGPASKSVRLMAPRLTHTGHVGGLRAKAET